MQARDSLSAEERENFSKIICEKLLPYLKDRRILSYSPIGSEVDVSYINEHFPVSLPVITKHRKMEAYLKDASLIINSYGIAEPDPSCCSRIDRKDLDVIIVPCVGFDEKKNRLGHGGGYYDLYLKDCKAFKIGVAFEAQKISEAFAMDHDIPLDLIITEESAY